MNTMVNFADVFLLIKAFQGDQCPFGPAESEENCPQDRPATGNSGVHRRNPGIAKTSPAAWALNHMNPSHERSVPAASLRSMIHGTDPRPGVENCLREISAVSARRGSLISS